MNYGVLTPIFEIIWSANPFIQSTSRLPWFGSQGIPKMDPLAPQHISSVRLPLLAAPGGHRSSCRCMTTDDNGTYRYIHSFSICEASFASLPPMLRSCSSLSLEAGGASSSRVSRGFPSGGNIWPCGLIFFVKYLTSAKWAKLDKSDKSSGDRKSLGVISGHSMGQELDVRCLSSG